MPALLSSLSLLHKFTFTPPSLSKPLCTMFTAELSPKLISPTTTRVGWIGTGVMGQFMCTHLLNAGYKLTVFNRTISKAQPLLELGAHLAESTAAVAKQSDVVFTILGNPSDVTSVVLDPTSGLLAHLAPNSIIVDMTTSDPSLASNIAKIAAEKSISSVDAPVSGGDRGARSGTLSIFAGGDSSIISALNPLMSLLGTTSHMGGPGAGQSAKLANQITVASTMVGVVEGIIFAHRAGLDVGVYLEAVKKGSAGSKSLEVQGARIIGRDMVARFYVEHFVKDLGICLKECERMGVCLPGLALAHQLYLSLKAHGEGRLGIQALVLALERLNNTTL